MADFPCTPILDTANRPDEGPPPSANWITFAGWQGVVVSGNEFAADPGVAPGAAMWKTPTVANGEVYLTYPHRQDDGDEVSFVFRDQSGDFSTTAYLAIILRDDTLGDTIRIEEKLTGLVGSPWSIVYQDGDSFGARFCGSTLSIYQCPTGGAWTLVGSVVDSQVTGAGYIGFDLTQGSARAINFGGGDASDECCGITPVVEAPMVTTKCSEDPILALVCANGDRLDLITWEAGFELDDPGWRPQVAQFKGGGSYANSQIAEGQTLVAGEYDNVTETIPLIGRGTSEAKCIQTYRRLQQFIKRASDYWKEPSEYDDVWLEVRPSGVGCRIGYARVIKASCVDFANPYGQPFFSQQAYSIADGLSLVVEREPLWRAVPPGSLIGPLYNLLKNPDFEQWNAGVADSQPDCWSDVEIGGITGTNARDTAVPKWGEADFVVDVTNSTGAGQAKGVTQVAEGTEDGQEYTFVGWVRNAGIANGVGRILITSLLGQYEVYRSATRHGWTLYTYVFTAGVGDVIGVNCEILSTAAGTDGTVYFDSLMLLKGDWEQEAIDGMLPYMSSSHIYNHWDTGAGHLNFVDAWEVPGDGDALVRLEVVNNTTPADFTNVVEKIAKLRVGQRRTGDVQNFQNYHDPASTADVNSSNGDRIAMTPTPEWDDVTTCSVVGEGDVADNVGRFRVLVRLYDTKATGAPTLQARLAYWLGVSGTSQKTLTGVSVPAARQWCMVGLTPNAAMVTDSKFSSNFPGALSYTVQLRKPTGSAVAGLDYVLTMPTDGGYLEADITPGLEKGVALVADNTASQAISATGIRAGYNYQVLLSTDYYVQSFASFKGMIYAGTRAFGAPVRRGGIWRRSGNWAKVYDVASASVMALEVYNGKLHALLDQFVGNTLLLSSINGTSWGTSASSAVTSGWCMKAFNGKLWIGLDSGAQGFIYSWDGSSLTLEFTIPLYGGGDQIPYALEVYQNKLYLGTGFSRGQVYAYTPGVGWAFVYDTGEQDVYSLRQFNGKLYAGTGQNGRIFVFDGATWTQVYNPGFVSYIFDLIVRDDFIFAARSPSGATGNAILLNSSDGLTWNLFYDTGTLESLMKTWVHEGDVFLSVLSVGDTGEIFTFVSDKPYEYSVANYQLGGGQNGGFTAPNRRLPDNSRRHRWVFSFDRSDESNVISDQALVGIGYVSRYLSLLGEG